MGTKRKKTKPEPVPVVTKKPYLVQRVERREVSLDRQRGIDSFFAFDYMGSSEFEWGALPDALKVMRAAKNAKSTKKNPVPKFSVQKIVEGRHEVYFVGPSNVFTVAQELFAAELEEYPKTRLKESTYISYAYGTRQGRYLGEQTIGWWCIDNDLPFCLFKTKADAETWMGCL